MASKLRTGRKAAKKGAKAWMALQVVERVATPTRARAPKTKVLVASAATGAVGAAGVYFLDPQQGARRRNLVRDKGFKYLRRGKQEAAQKVDYAAGQAAGAAHEARQKASGGPEAKPELTDQELARKVETEIFRDADVPKGDINVDAVGRTVTLRGQADSQARIDTLVRQANAIPEVEVVENLLHLPGEPAPTRADTPEAQRA